MLTYYIVLGVIAGVAAIAGVLWLSLRSRRKWWGAHIPAHRAVKEDEHGGADEGYAETLHELTEQIRVPDPPVAEGHQEHTVALRRAELVEEFAAALRGCRSCQPPTDKEPTDPQFPALFASTLIDQVDRGNVDADCDLFEEKFGQTGALIIGRHREGRQATGDPEERFGRLQAIDVSKHAEASRQDAEVQA